MVIDLITKVLHTLWFLGLIGIVHTSERLNGLPHAGFQIMSVFKPTVGRLFPLPVPIECHEILSVAIGAAVPQLSWKKIVIIGDHKPLIFGSWW